MSGVSYRGSYLGPVASTRAFPQTFAGAVKQLQARTRHVAMQDIYSLQVIYPNWYLNGAFAEAGPGSDTTFQGGIETGVVAGGTNLGTFKWSGASTVVSPTFTNSIISDPLWLTAPIAKGSYFYSRTLQENATGCIYSAVTVTGVVKPQCDNANGEQIRFAAAGIISEVAATGNLVSGTVNASGSILFGPALLLANTHLPTWFLNGDSRQMGLAQAFDGTTMHKGEMAPSIGPYFAYINCGFGSDRADKYIASHARREELMAYCSHRGNQYGINDLANARTGLQVYTDLLTIGAYSPTKPQLLSTATPVSTGGPWTSLATQTPAAYSAQWSDLNDRIRTGQLLYMENADIVTPSRNDSRWLAGANTFDGTHGELIAMQLLAAQNGFSPLKYVR